MMVSPKDLKSISIYFNLHNLKFSSFIDNVEEVVTKENEKHVGTLFSTYTGYDYGRYHSLREVIFYLFHF